MVQPKLRPILRPKLRPKLRPLQTLYFFRKRRNTDHGLGFCGGKETQTMVVFLGCFLGRGRRRGFSRVPQLILCARFLRRGKGAPSLLEPRLFFQPLRGLDPRLEARYPQDFQFLLQSPRTPEGFQKGFRRVSKGVSEGVSEGFSKGFRRVLN